MGLGSSFYIALRGLHISQAAIEVVSHNVANVNTEGYSRQRLNLEAAMPERNTRYGPIGLGVDATSITRMHDQFITRNLTEKSSLLAKYEAQKISIDYLESIYNETDGNGINEALSEFWSSWQQVANNPEGNAERTDLLEKGITLASHINMTRIDMDSLRTDINQRVEEGVAFANTLIKEIAKINEMVVALEAGDLTQANDLRDRREEYVKQLAEYMDIQYYEDPANNTLAVLTPKGTPLVLEASAWSLSANRNEEGDIRVNWVGDNGRKVDITENIETGQLGGWIELRDEIMTEFYLQLDSFAEGLIREVNRLHAQGVGLERFTDVTGAQDISDNASFLTELEGDDNDIHFTALAEGDLPEAVGIRYVKNTSVTDGLSVDTQYNAATDSYGITVYLAINNLGQVITTAQEVIDLVNADRTAGLPSPPPYPPVGPPYHAGDLVRAEAAHGETATGKLDTWTNPADPEGGGLNYNRLNHNLEHTLFFGQEITYAYERAQLETEVAGDQNDLVYTALASGAPGETISVEYVATPGNAVLSLDPIAGGAIRVNLVTLADGTVTTTAEEVFDLISTDPAARTMVSVERASGNDGTGRLRAMPQSFLDRSGSFEIITYDSTGQATINKVVVNPDDRIEDVLNQIGSTSTTGIQGISAELVEDSGNIHLRIKAAQGYEFAFARDSASALMALGVNTFFEGTGPSDIAVNDTVLDNLRLIAAGRVDEDGIMQSGDNTNALDLADLKDAKFDFRQGYGSISDAFNTLSAGVGAETHNITRGNDFHTALVDQLYAQRDMVSAVNLDEEMADLLKFQYMYQASAKMISAVDELLQTLLSIK
jgi:flagellar hook-associated protein 1 FlgK